LTGAVLAWLESHGRKIVNNGRALQLEISKIAQYTALADFGIRTPRTIAAVGVDNIVAAARRMSGPFITKHNRAGIGLGVRLFRDVEALREHVASSYFELSVDGITLIQEYIQATEPFITRTEFVGGRFLYAVRVDTSLGFELCPADVCQVDSAFCPADTPPAAARFRIVRGFSHPLIGRYERFLAANGIGIAGIEFITDREGEIYTYDVNTNMNYNADAEREAGVFGMRAIAAYLERERRTLEHGERVAIES
jgi:glutathione synthase/RimK-type ligase-like ATP-grasp enzyme